MLRDSDDVGRGVGWALALVPLALSLFFASFLSSVASGKTLSFRKPWVPTLGVNLSFTVDGLSLLFVLLITGIGTLVLIYAGGYMAGRQQLGRFYALLLIFMASMLGLVTADNLLLLYVFWELTSLSSYFLIGFEHERSEARAAALQALLVTGAGGLALLAGFILLGQAGGSLEISSLLQQGASLRAHPLYGPALMLVLAGAFTKSAQFPFHFWLPSAMEAPTPVSAYLHSATMVKAGVYLLARLHPALGETPIWEIAVSAVGATTMVVASVLALVQADLKRILAYSTISALGLMVLLLGIGSSGAVKACMVFLLAHALYKGALFMVAGILDHETGTRDVSRLGGLARAMPVTAAAALLAAISQAGLGPVLSFIGKEMAFEAVLSSQAWQFLAPAAVLVGGVFVTVAGLAGCKPFYGKRSTTPRSPHEASVSLLAGPVLLSAAGFYFGLFPSGVANSLMAPAVSVVWGEPVNIELALWHDINPSLGLSAASLVLGLALFGCWSWLHRHRYRFEPLLQWGPARAYDAGLQGLMHVALGQTRLLQSGYLRYYLMITMAATILLVGYALLGRGAWTAAFPRTELRFYEAGLAALMLLAILAAILVKARLAAIAALGVVGYSVALVYVLFGAPDLAMTQFLVETLTVILFVLVFYHLPETRAVSDGTARWRDAALAAMSGVLMSALVLVGIPQNYPPTSEYFEEHSVSGGHGRNVVNVIIVDFRALDTLGEITVLTVTALGVYALLKLRIRPQSASASSDHVTSADAGSSSLPERSPAAVRAPKDLSEASLILRSATRLLLPLLLLFSLFLLARGHNEPGGGFSGGLVAASALILYRFAFGAQETRRILPVNPLVFSGAGLLMAVGSGVPALLQGRPLMTGFWQLVAVPGFDDLHVGTPLLFDVGVFVTVVGVTLSIILPLAEE